jgi:hypothetical protein
MRLLLPLMLLSSVALASVDTDPSGVFTPDQSYDLFSGSDTLLTVVNPTQWAQSVRLQWTAMRTGYLQATAQVCKLPANATYCKGFTAALDKVGLSLDVYLTNRLAGYTLVQMIPCTKTLFADILTVQVMRLKSPSGLSSILTGVLTRANETITRALASMS